MPEEITQPNLALNVNETEVIDSNSESELATVVNEDETWQEAEAHQEQEQTELAAVETAAEIEQLQQDQIQTITLTEVLREIQNLRESMTLSAEAQTAELISMRNILSELPNFSETKAETIKPKRRNPAQRAEERRRRLADRKAARKV